MHTEIDEISFFFTEIDEKSVITQYFECINVAAM